MFINDLFFWILNNNDPLRDPHLNQSSDRFRRPALSMSIDPDTVLPELSTLLREFDVSLQPLAPADGVERFLQSKRPELASSTYRHYRGKLDFFLEYTQLNDIGNLNELTSRDLDDYYRWRHDESSDHVDTLAIITIHDDMKLLRTFLEYLESIDAVQPGLADDVHVPTLSPDEESRDIELHRDRAQRILDYLDEYKYATQEHIVLLIHCHTGRRPGGVHALDLQDFHTDTDNPYLHFRHREGETPLKNGLKSEEEVNIPSSCATVITDFIENNRDEVTDEYGRDPLITTSQGRLAISTMRTYFYKWTRPCQITGSCPHDKTIEDCQAAQSNDDASKCPSSLPPYSARHGHVTQLRRDGIPTTTISERCDLSEEILEKHYDERTTEEKRELRRKLLEEVYDEQGGYP